MSMSEGEQVFSDSTGLAGSTSVDSSASRPPSSAQTGFASQRSNITVIAPPVKLGIFRANKAESKGTVVSGVRTSSVVTEKISPGDRIVAIDGDDVSLMTLSDITTPTHFGLHQSPSHDYGESEFTAGTGSASSSPNRSDAPLSTPSNDVLGSSSFPSIEQIGRRPLPDQSAFDGDDDGDEGEFLYMYHESNAIVALAIQNYEIFHQLEHGTASVRLIEQTSAGIVGWASCEITETPSRTEMKQEGSHQNQVSAETVTSPQRQRKCDQEEARELQLALLESIGVKVGCDAKRSRVHGPTGYVDEGMVPQIDDQDEWSYKYEDDASEEAQDNVSLQSDTDEEDLTSEGFHVIAVEGLRIGNDTDSVSSASSFVMVQSSDATSFAEEDCISEIDLTPAFAGALKI